MPFQPILRLASQRWLWLAPYAAISLFAIAMLTLTAFLQMRETETARSALEGDIHWAERTIDGRLASQQDFLADLARDAERHRLNPATFQTRTASQLAENPDIVAIMRVTADGHIEWAAPEGLPKTSAGSPLPPELRDAFNDAIGNGRTTFSRVYSHQNMYHALATVRPILAPQGHTTGALIAIYSLENLLNATLPSSFSTKYNLTLEDEQGQRIIANSSQPPSDRGLAGQVRLNLFDGRVRLAIVAYRTGGIWLPYIPATLIALLTAITAATLVALRRNAKRRAESEEQLRTAYAFRQAMSQSLLTGIRAIDMEGRITYVNNAFCRMVGWEEEELLGMQPPYPYWPPEEANQLARFVTDTLNGEPPLGRSETRVMHRNGERIDVSVYVSPLVDATGQQLGWMVAMIDITEAKRIRDELKQAQDRFITVVDGLDSAVHVADSMTGEILFANRVFQTLFGFDAVGRIASVVVPNLQPPQRALLRDPTRLTARELPCELFDGEVPDNSSGRWYHIHDRAIRWVDGRTVRVNIATDMTEKKNLDDLNRQQQKRVEETSRLITMGEMASTLAHELNQPLSAITNYCAGSVKRLESGNYQVEDVLAALKKAGNQAQRAGTIIHRMRDMVRKSDPHLTPVFLADLVDETLALANIEAHKAQVEITLDIPADLPKVIADRIMIEQVLLNLVKNGIEAMHSVALEERNLVIGAQIVDERMLEISVADRGSGLQEKEMEKIFAPFYTTKSEGLGIGLAICRSIVEFHQGRLWVESRQEGGTVFKFTLPRETN